LNTAWSLATSSDAGEENRLDRFLNFFLLLSLWTLATLVLLPRFALLLAGGDGGGE
jgi:hypothetical protein